MRLPVLVVILAVLLAVDSLFASWWVVVLFGLVIGLVSVRRPVLVAVASTALAWGGLLLWSTLSAPAETRALAQRLGTLLPVGAVGLYVVTILFGVLLAALAAALGRSLRSLLGLGRASLDLRVERKKSSSSVSAA